MNKAELVDAVIALNPGLGSKAGSERALNAVLAAVLKGLKKDKKVQIVGFGTFSVRKRGARQVRNPKTQQMMKVKAKRVVHFKPGKPLNDAI